MIWEKERNQSRHLPVPAFTLADVLSWFDSLLVQLSWADNTIFGIRPPLHHCQVRRTQRPDVMLNTTAWLVHFWDYTDFQYHTPSAINFDYSRILFTLPSHRPVLQTLSLHALSPYQNVFGSSNSSSSSNLMHISDVHANIKTVPNEIQ